jgi:hypothetical protein
MNHIHQTSSGFQVSHQVNKWEVNITPLERFGRITIGLIGVVGGIFLLTSSPTFWTGSLEVLLITAGLDLIITGATGYCPLYNKIGYTPSSLKEKKESSEHCH